MSLARGIDSVQLDQPAPPAHPLDQHLLDHRTVMTQAHAPVVIAIAATSAERLHLAALVGDHAPVLLVGSREEALALLRGSPADALSPPAIADGRLAPHRSGPAVATPAPGAAAADAWRQLATTDRVDPPSRDDVRPALIVDSDLREARWLDRRVPLSPLEHDVLVHLVRSMGRTLTFEHLHREVWGSDHLGGGGDVQSVVKRLRRKLHHLGTSLRIQPVRGVGLRLVHGQDEPAV